MTDADAAGGGQAPSPNIAALVEALDARARAAGTEGATTVLRGMVGSVSETMGSIEDRLERLEQRLTGGVGATETALAEAVQSALSSFNARLGRLEEAFVQAVEESGSGTEQVVDQIRDAVIAAVQQAGALGAASASDGGGVADVGGPDLSERLTTAVAPILTRLESLEIAVRKPQPLPAQHPPPPVPDLAGAVAPLTQLLHRIESSVQQLLDETEVVPPADVGVAIAPFAERMERLEGALRGLADRPAATAEPTDVSAALAPLAEQVDRIESGLRAMADRPAATAEPTDVSAALAPLAEQVDRIESGLRAMADRPAPPPPAAAPAVDLTPLLGRLDALAKRVDDATSAVTAAAAAGTTGQRGDVDHSPVLAALRSEAELLTQRVAALAVGVEATRAMLEQHVTDAEGSLGRKATEVGRRLAADLGLRPKPSRWRRDRELGPG